MAANPRANPQHGYHSYYTATEAINAVAQAWVDWRLENKIGSPAVAKRDAEFFCDHFQKTLPGGWWLSWSRTEQEAFLRDMEHQRDRFKVTGLSRTAQLPSAVGGAASMTLERMLRSYGRVVYLAKQLSVFVQDFSAHLVGIDGLGLPVPGRPLLSEADFDGEHAQYRQAVAGQLQRLLDALKEGKLTDVQIARLPQLRNTSNTELLALVQMIHRIDGREAAAAAARAHGAHSLAHRSVGRVELSPRQQVQYGRRYAGL